MTETSAKRRPWTLRLLAASLLLGGLREPRLGALGEAAVLALVWLERPALGPAAAWLPWLGWALVCAAAGPEPLAAAPVLARWAAALGFLSLAAAWGEGERRAWLRTLLGLAVPLGAAALWTGWGRGWGTSMTGLLPPYYNYAAFALSAAAAAGAACALHPRASRGERLAGLGAAALGAACVILARSRGAWLGLAAAAVVWSCRRWGARALGAAALAAVVGLAAFRAGLVPQAARTALFKTDRQYRDARLAIWSSAAAVASERPLVGAGPGAFGAGFARHPAEAPGGPARWGWSTPYAHSEPLQAAGETGWAGLALWLIGFAALLGALRGRAGPEPAREAAAAALAAAAVQLGVDDMLQLPGLAFLFFSAAAVAGARLGSSRRWPRAAAGVLAALALAAWIPRALAGRSPERAAALFPAEAGAFEDLAYRAADAGGAARADALWARAAALAPFDAIYPWRRAQIARARGDWGAAEALAAKAAELEPGFSSARVLRAEALARLGRRAEARAELDAVAAWIRSRPDRPRSDGYEATIWGFDGAEFERVAELAGGR